MRASGYRALWVDQICINQNDASERSEQVRLMSKVYSRAAKVLVYLGEETERAKAALAGMKEVISQIKSDNEAKLKSRNPNAVSASTFNQQVWLNWLSLYEEYDWFSRVWVIQEAVLADDLEFMIGGRTFDGGLLFYGMRYLEDHLSNIELSQDVRTETIDILQGWSYFRFGYSGKRASPMFMSMNPTIPNPSWDFWSALWSLRTFDATNNADKVYALLGLFAEDEDANSIPVDVRLTPQAVYTDAAARLLVSSNYKLESVLRLSGRVLQSMPGLPSWVPDWSSNAEWNFLRGTPWETSGFNSSAKLVRSGKALKVEGALFDTVKDVTEPLKIKRKKIHYQPEHLDTREWIEIGTWHRQVGNFLSSAPSHRYSDPKTSRAFLAFRLLNFDHYAVKEDAGRDASYSEAMFQRYLEALNYATSPKRQTLTSSTPNPEMFAMIKTIAVFPQNHRACVTEGGLFGLIPEVSRIGDRIGVIPGLGNPLVLRSEALTSYSYLGGAFVIDLKEGDVLRSSKLGTFTLV